MRQLTRESSNNTEPSWSPDARKIAFVSDRDGNREIYVMNADGSKETRLTQNQGDAISPAWSPDGREIAFVSVRDGTWGIYLMDEAGNNVRTLATGAIVESRPSWSPDGKRIVYCSHSPQKIDGYLRLELFVMDADGNNPTMITSDSRNLTEPCWSPHATWIALSRVVEQVVPGVVNIYTLDTGSKDLRRITSVRAIDGNPAWSPDGKKIAFQSNRDGNWEIYVLQLDY